MNGDGNDATILDLSFVIDRVFRGGDPSPCPSESDVNNDGNILTVLDMAYLIEFMFRGGPPPSPC